jgi:PfaB family protein
MTGLDRRVAVTGFKPTPSIKGTYVPPDSDGVMAPIVAYLAAEDPRRSAVLVVGPIGSGCALPAGWFSTSFSNPTAALIEACRIIQSGEMDTVLLLLAGGTAPGSCVAAAITLRSAERAGVLAETPLAWLVAAVQAGAGQSVASALSQAADLAKLPLTAIGYAELPEGDDLGADSVAREAAAVLFQCGASVWAHLFDQAGDIAPLVAVARAIEALRCAHVFASRHPGWAEGLEAISFVTRPLPWIQPLCGRVGLVVTASVDGAAVFVLTEYRGRRTAIVQSRLGGHDAALIPIAGTDADDLDRQILELAGALENGESYHAAARRCRRLFTTGRPLPLAAGLVARSQAEAQREAKFLRRALQIAQRTGNDGKTPLGSIVSLNPLGPDVPVTFVYPGAGSAYPGMGSDLFALFPGLMRRFEAGFPDGAEWYRAAAALYPSNLGDLDEAGHQELERRVAADTWSQISGSCFFSLILTHLVRDLMGIAPGSAMGYCIGESMMMASIGVWPEVDKLHANWIKSDLFRARLCNDMAAVREAWGLDGELSGPIADLWRTFLVLAGREDVAAAIRGEPRVYLTIVNSPSQVVIAGDGAACERVIARMGCRSMPLPFNVPIHCEAMASEWPALVDFHRLPVTPKRGVTLFSQHRSSIPQQVDTIAEAIADTYTKHVDYPAIIEAAYAAGARIFIELGARQMCASWISETLGDRRHLAVSLDVKDTDPALTLLRGAARLIAHRVPLDLDALIGED